MMKEKILCCLLAVMLIISCTACGSGTDTTSQMDADSSETSSAEEETSVEEEPVEDEGPSDEDLVLAVENIKEAEDLINSMAATQLDHWSKYSNIMKWYFDDEEYMNAVGDSATIKRAEQLHEDRTDASEKLSEAKELMGTSGTGDYYDSVKSYYLLVKDYLSLVSTFPEGYSKLTFSSTVSDFNTDCQSAYNELEFYMD
ncbi:MAG: hypothetical protein LUH16_04565 [Clostridiales bacterium]|nr:hypothetical protein [Clostridiales bacterium]